MPPPIKAGEVNLFSWRKSFGLLSNQCPGPLPSDSYSLKPYFRDKLWLPTASISAFSRTEKTQIPNFFQTTAYQV